MSPRNLLRRFKAATGHLPGEYIQLLRVTAARQLLERGRSPVQKVAHAVGYAFMWNALASLLFLGAALSLRLQAR